MTHKEVYDLLVTLGYPVAYDHFDTNKNVTPPFLVYREIASNTFKADNKTFYRPYEFQIELITEKKNTTLQSSLESLLDTNNIPYDVDDEIWDEDEKIYHNFYEI